MHIQLEWDKNKNSRNIQKHGVSFEEEKIVFHDENSRLISDPDHSSAEERFVLLGFSGTNRLLIIVHCYKQNDEIIRIISARKANKTEKTIYQRSK